MSSRRTMVQRIPSLPPGRDDHFYGYGVMGLPFASGHVLAMRKMHSSDGPKYQSVWHRSPDGAWTMWSDVAPSQSCPRYWGNDLQQAIQASIDISWPGPSRMTVKVDDGRELDWEVQLGSTLVTRALSRGSHRPPCGDAGPCSPRWGPWRGRCSAPDAWRFRGTRRMGNASG
jgi:hypothetical protein